MDSAIDQPKPKQENRQHDVVKIQIVFKIDHAQQFSTGYGLQAVFTAGKWRLQIKEIDQLRQCQSNHGEINALPAYRQTADDVAQTRSGERASNQP